MIGEFAAFGTALCWTVSAVIYKKALVKTKPISANIVRCVETSLILVLVFALIRKFDVFTSLSVHVIFLASLSGIIGLGLGDTLYMNSLEILGVARAVPVTCTYPLFSLIWAFLLTGEILTPPVLLGAIAIVFGTWLLSGRTPNSVDKKSEKTLWIKGLAFAILAAISWSVSISLLNLAVKETAGLEQAYAINTIRLIAVAVFLLASASVGDVRLSILRMGWKTAIMLLFGGLIALGLGWFLLTLSFLYIPGSQAIPISSTTPLFSALSSVVFLHEKVTARIAIGSTVIVAGIFLIFMV